MIYETGKKKIVIELLKNYVGNKLPTMVGLSNIVEQSTGNKITRQTLSVYIRELKSKKLLIINSKGVITSLSQEPLVKKPGSSRNLSNCGDSSLLKTEEAELVKGSIIRLCSWAGLGLKINQVIENIIYDLINNVGYDKDSLEYGEELTIRNNLDSYNYNSGLVNYIKLCEGESSLFYFPEGPISVEKNNILSSDRYKLIDTLLMICSQRKIKRIFITFITSNYKDPVKMYSYRVPQNNGWPSAAK